MDRINSIAVSLPPRGIDLAAVFSDAPVLACRTAGATLRNPGLAALVDVRASMVIEVRGNGGPFRSATAWEGALLAGARGAALWVVAAVGYLILEAAAAAGFKPSYSYARNYISDLGLTAGDLAPGRMIDSPRADLMHVAFYLQGVLFLLGALAIVGVLDSRRARLFLGLVAANAVGNIVVGTLHSGSVHVAGAALAIVGGNAAILAGSSVIGPVIGHPWYRITSTLIAALGILCLIMLLVDSATTRVNLLPSGAWERGSVYSITAWQLLTAAGLLIGGRPPTASRYSKGGPG